MNATFIRALVMAAALGLAAAAGSARAAVTCTVGVGTLSFGTYDVFSALPDDSTTPISVTCTQAPRQAITVSVTVTSSTGLSGNYNNRQMGNGVNRLSYNLYKDNARTVLWGDGSGSTLPYFGTLGFNGVVSTLTANGTIYGRIPAAQDVAGGLYSDTIVATVNF